MEKVFKQIDGLLARSKEVVSKSRQEKIKLYSEGLKTKLSQVQYALARLESFNNRTDDMESTTDKDDASITQKVNFYCDTFWTFLYSSLDVLSQIINQALKLGLDEENVKFKSVEGKLQGNAHKSLSVAKKYSECRNSHCYSNLDKYRNCSIHRRQIFIVETITKQKTTPGYSTASEITTVTRFLCDDPLTVKPKINQNRDIPKYMVDTKEKVIKHIDTILEETQPIK
jgi:hypothetical protein